MLTAEENERLTRVGPGTPMGTLMRRYWHPVATCHELAENPVRTVRILGESLTLFRDRKGRCGLVGQRCAHRRVDLKCGIPEDDGLRCPYHGWKYDHAGQCIEQPAEIGNANVMARVKLPSYPVQELGGLVWAYLGPDPAPLLPRWDLFVVDNAFRQIGTTVVQCNWLQCQENSADSIHSEWAHGHLGLYLQERKGIDDPKFAARYRDLGRRHIKADYKRVPVGIQKLRQQEGDSENSDAWHVGHPLVFPNMVRIGFHGYAEFQIRVPMDDTHTWHLSYQTFFPGQSVAIPKQDPVPSFTVPIEADPTVVLSQDYACWEAQGEICDRTEEHLGRSDVGVVMLRKLLMEQIEVVENGGDPINTFRDPRENQILNLSMENYGVNKAYQKGDIRFMPCGFSSPVFDKLDALMMQGAEAARTDPARQ
jgi:5,5'-dehydrodivanillate O-demethylase